MDWMKVSKRGKCDCKLVDLLCKHAFWADSLGLWGEVYQDAMERLQGICLAMGSPEGCVLKSLDTDTLPLFN